MKNTIIVSAIIFTTGFVTLPVVWSDDDFHWGDIDEYRHQSNSVKKVTNPLYEDECGSCHMAYPPGLMPAPSWEKVMLGLEDHFDDNAELNKEEQMLITQYLLNNSADKSRNRRSQKFNRSINSHNVPVRITDTPYFRHEHHEIPIRMVTANSEVNSFSQCDACHKNAKQGSFNEHDIHIPGYGHWDD